MNNRIIDGAELLRLVIDGKILNGGTIRFGGNVYTFNTEEQDFFEKGKPTQKQYSIFQNWTIDGMLTFKFEILSEEDVDIDIQAIEEFIIPATYSTKEADMWSNRIVINKLIKAVKKIDKELKK